MKNEVMKNRPEHKVQICTYNDITNVTDFRKVLWRFDPEELSWWDRIFNNSWKYLHHNCGHYLSPLFTASDYMKIKSSIKTYADVIAYIEREEKKAVERRERFIGMGLIWPDEPLYAY